MLVRELLGAGTELPLAPVAEAAMGARTGATGSWYRAPRNS